MTRFKRIFFEKSLDLYANRIYNNVVGQKSNRWVDYKP